MMALAVSSEPLSHSFGAVTDAKTRVLVLGSLPGAMSLARAQYYAHPQNHFWRLIGAVIERELMPLPYEKRLETLLDAGVGLWDTVGSATRRGSLDADIRLHKANDLAAHAAALPDLRAIGFNGAKSASIGRKQLRERAELTLIDLPSSSPAYTLAFESKLEAWMSLRRFL
jgi:hypoxanthine-DNA glycosylase